MQTFLPYADYAQSAASLDDSRLGKQRVEAYQILLQLAGIKMADYPDWQPRLGGWGHHPAVAMWAGHELALAEYIDACCDEWTGRTVGLEDGTLRARRDTVKANTAIAVEIARADDWLSERPGWIGDEEVHRTHRSNLLRKDPEYYATRFPEDIPAPGQDYLEYIWPKTGFVTRDRMVTNYQRMVDRKIADF